jgi:3-oxoacyl-[acyl-carrier protein] reductase
MQSMTNLKSKVALLTGSARGIGKAIAERSGSLGASVVVNYAASEGPAQETVKVIKRFGGTAIAVQADVSRVVEIERLFAMTIERYGRLDIVLPTPASNSLASRSWTSLRVTSTGYSA